MVKGAALFLQQGSSHQGQKAHPNHKHAGENRQTRHMKGPRLVSLSVLAHPGKAPPTLTPAGVCGPDVEDEGSRRTDSIL